MNELHTPPASGSKGMRSRTLIELLEATFRIYRDHLPLLLAFSVAVTIPTTVVSLTLNNSLIAGIVSSSANPSEAASLTLQACFTLLFVILVNVVGTAVLYSITTYIASEGQFGRKLTFAQAWNEVSPHITRVAIAYLFFFITLGVASAVISFTALLCPLLLLVFTFLLFYAVLVGGFLAPVALLETGSPLNALMRAYQLAKPRFWQLAALGGILLVLTFFAQLIADSLVSLFFTPSTADPVTRGLFSLATGIAVNSFTTPLLPIAMTLLYYDTRIRSERLDQALADYGEQARPRDVGVPQQMLNLPLIDSRDTRTLVILFGIMMVVFLLLNQIAIAMLGDVMPGFTTLP